MQIKNIFEKEFGKAKQEQDFLHGNSKISSFTFEFNNHTTVKFILMEEKTNHFVLHYESSKESSLLLKRIFKCFDNIQHFGQKRGIHFSLSDELAKRKKENFVKASIRCSLQNKLNKITIFN